MDERNIGGVPIYSSDGRLVGILTRRDLAVSGIVGNVRCPR
jgi:CBS domain-containing protein